MTKSTTNDSMQPSSNFYELTSSDFAMQAKSMIKAYHKITNDLTQDMNVNQDNTYEIYLDNIQDLLNRDFTVFKKMPKYKAVIEIAEWLTQADYAEEFLEEQFDETKKSVDKMSDDLDLLKELNKKMANLAEWASRVDDPEVMSEKNEVLTLANTMNIDIAQEDVTLQAMQNLVSKLNQILYVALPAWRDQLKALKMVYLA